MASASSGASPPPPPGGPSSSSGPPPPPQGEALVHELIADLKKLYKLAKKPFKNIGGGKTVTKELLQCEIEKLRCELTGGSTTKKIVPQLRKQDSESIRQCLDNLSSQEPFDTTQEESQELDEYQIPPPSAPPAENVVNPNVAYAHPAADPSHGVGVPVPGQAVPSASGRSTPSSLPSPTMSAGGQGQGQQG